MNQMNFRGWKDKNTVLRSIGRSYEHWQRTIEASENPSNRCPMCLASAKASGTDSVVSGNSSCGKCSFCPAYLYLGHRCWHDKHYDGYCKSVKQRGMGSDEANYNGMMVLDALVSLWLWVQGGVIT